jgi:hypothetical protein
MDRCLEFKHAMKAYGTIQEGAQEHVKDGKAIKDHLFLL